MSTNNNYCNYRVNNKKYTIYSILMIGGVVVTTSCNKVNDDSNGPNIQDVDRSEVIKRQIASANQKAKELEEKNNILDDSNSNLSTENSNLERSVSQKDLELADKNVKIEELKKEKDNIQKFYTICTTGLEEVRNKVLLTDNSNPLKYDNSKQYDSNKQNEEQYFNEILEKIKTLTKDDKTLLKKSYEEKQSELKLELNEIENELDKKQKILSDLEQKVNSSTLDIEKINLEIGIIENKIKESNEKINLHPKIAELKAKEIDLQEKYSSLQKKTDLKKAEIKKDELMQDEIRKKFEKIEEEKNRLIAIFTKIKEALGEDKKLSEEKVVEKIKEKISSPSKKTGEANSAQVNTFLEKINSVLGDKNKIQKGDNEEKIKSAIDEFIESKVSNLKSEVSKFNIENKELEKIQKDVEKINDEKSEIIKQLKTIDTSIEEKSDFSNLLVKKADIDKINGEKSKLEAEKILLEKEVTSLTSAIKFEKYFSMPDGILSEETKTRSKNLDLKKKLGVKLASKIMGNLDDIDMKALKEQILTAVKEANGNKEISKTSLLYEANDDKSYQIKGDLTKHYYPKIKNKQHLLWLYKLANDVIVIFYSGDEQFNNENKVVKSQNVTPFIASTHCKNGDKIEIIQAKKDSNCLAYDTYYYQLEQSFSVSSLELKLKSLAISDKGTRFTINKKLEKLKEKSKEIENLENQYHEKKKRKEEIGNKIATLEQEIKNICIGDQFKNSQIKVREFEKNIQDLSTRLETFKKIKDSKTLPVISKIEQKIEKNKIDIKNEQEAQKKLIENQNNQKNLLEDEQKPLIESMNELNNQIGVLKEEMEDEQKGQFINWHDKRKYNDKNDNNELKLLENNNILQKNELKVNAIEVYEIMFEE